MMTLGQGHVESSQLARGTRVYASAPEDSRVKVGVSVRRFGPHGGMERVALGFVRWLAAGGHTVEVWSNSYVEIGPTVRHRPLGAGGRGVMWRAKSLAAAVAAIPTEECDVFLHFERGARGGAYRAGSGCAAAQAVAEGPNLSWPLIRAIDERTCRAAAPLIVNSEMVRTEMIRHYTVSPERIRLVRNGVDLARFKPGPKAEHPTMVFVGANARRKGLKTALRALQLVPEARLEVVGDVRSVAKRWAARLGVADRVRFHGDLAAPEAIISRAHVMVLPTRYDASANACLEAMACGVPVVTTEHNGASELAPTPWLVLSDPMDANHCAEVLRRAMSDRTLPEACRSIAQAHAADHAYGELLDALVGGEA